MIHKMKHNSIKHLLLLSVILLLLSKNSVLGQAQPEITFSNTTMAAWQEDLPFWFWANQNGLIAPGSKFLNLSVLGINSAKRNDPSLLNINWGTTLAGGLASANYFQFNQLYAGIEFKGWLLKAGRFHEETYYNGLSTTNGNLAHSQNALPYPKIRFSTNGFKTLPFWNQRLAFKAEYDEGILNDDRFVERARLHHKSLYLSYKPSEYWYFEAGAEHYVMWGGNSPDARYGQLPEDFKSYLRYITGSMGGEKFPQTDQLNVAGNQLGTYQLKVIRSFEKADVTFYASHPFEDFSGVNLRNLPDNLLGLSLEIKDKTGFITQILYEYTNTRQQSIRDSLYEWNEEKEIWERMEFDNYYNHGYYRSGFTYHGKMMASPLFGPLKESDGIITGIRSNRFYAHHIGILGNLTEFVRWKGLFTSSHHLGTYTQPYEEPLNQFSVLLQLMINHPRLPFTMKLSGAADAGNQTGENSGFKLQVSKSF